MNMLSKFSPARGMSRSPFFSGFPSVWDDAFFGKDFNANVPAVNIAEDDKQFMIEVSAAGFRKEDFKVALEMDILTISAEHKDELNQDKKNYTRREFSKSTFSRSFRVKPETINVDAITANYENGVLHIAIPKQVEVKKEITKEIKVG